MITYIKKNNDKIGVRINNNIPFITIGISN
jgi:hypothetical protein